MNSGIKYTVIALLGAAVVSFALYFIVGGSNNEFKVTFDSDGGSSVDLLVVKKGEKATKPLNPSKEGYDFVEWQLDGKVYNFEEEVSKNITLKASWKQIVKHSVKVTIDGQEFTADIREGESITEQALNIPAKDGYKIVFYNDKDEEYDITKGLTEDVVLTAKYVEIKKYTVKFDSNGGEKIEAVKVEENTQVTEPAPSRDGYIFDGWYLGEDKFDFTTPITKDITLKAKWTETGKINVKFMVDDKEYKTIGVKENTKVTKPADPTKKGYKFVEWQLNEKAFDFNTKITEEITLVAKFEESKTVTITYDTDGGSKIESQNVEIDTKAKAPAEPTKAGYKFVEWQLDGKKFDFTKEVTQDIKLKAIWVKVHTVKFMVDDKELSSQIVVDGEKAKAPTAPTKAGYKFVEWLLSNSTYDFNKAVTKDITLIARFEKESAATPTPTPGSNSTPTPTPKPATPTPTPGSNSTPTPTPKPATPTPTPAPKTYTVHKTKVDNMSLDVRLTVYENNTQISFNKIMYNNHTVPTTVNANSISGITTFQVELTNGTVVNATVQ